jgi:hypothetical protein
MHICLSCRVERFLPRWLKGGAPDLPDVDLPDARLATLPSLHPARMHLRSAALAMLRLALAAHWLRLAILCCAARPLHRERCAALTGMLSLRCGRGQSILGDHPHLDDHRSIVFIGCTSLTSLIIPSQVDTIGGGEFYVYVTIGGYASLSSSTSWTTTPRPAPASLRAPKDHLAAALVRAAAMEPARLPRLVCQPQPLPCLVSSLPRSALGKSPG